MPSAINTLLESLGISPESFNRFVGWALAEHLVVALASNPEVAAEGFFSQPDALKRFRTILRSRTKRIWSDVDLDALFQRVKDHLTKHYRAPIEYGEYLKLLWQVPLQCVACGRAPPEVVLHVDHVVPASRGGSSKRPNLQFLCADCNLRKSNKREVKDLWLDLR
jgi:5-methylcytosine-specific restriction endonuclease McrA